MPESKTRHGAPWTVTAVAAGTPEAAALAAERARRLVSEWFFAGIVGQAEGEAEVTEARQPCR